MPLAAITEMSFADIVEYVEALENRVRELEGKTNNSKKLSRREARRIRGLYDDGFDQRTLADIFDVNRATISRIVRGVYYAEERY